MLDDPGAPETQLARELLSVTSRLVFDTTACLHPQQLLWSLEPETAGSRR